MSADERLDVDQDVGDPVEAIANFAFDVPRDFVGVANAEIWVDFKMQVDVIPQSGFAGVAFLDRFGSRNAERDVANLGD
jgi:hypothetical protein